MLSLKMEYEKSDVPSAFWATIGKTILPAFIPWLIYLVFAQNKRNRDMYGKVVLITGASSGLGEQLAHMFYIKGCKVILAARRVDELERVKKDLMELETDLITFPPEVLSLDLADLVGVSNKALEALSICGHIDILINNGGVSFRGDVLDTGLDVHMKVMMVNYFGTLALTKGEVYREALLPSMIERKQGHIVTIGSVQARIALPFRSAYGASKHAVQSFMDCLRSEMKDKRIIVTMINPGYIKTNLSVNAVTGSGQAYGVMDSTTESGYDPKEVADKIYWSIVKEEKEVTIAPLAPKVAIILRALFPSAFFFIMGRRAAKNSAS